MGKYYKTPPLLEAVGEFRFPAATKWASAIAERIYEKVRSRFPERRPGGQENPSTTQFHRRDGSALLQVAPHLLALNQLKPYPSWQQFKRTILEAYSAYHEIAGPAGIARLGLRYINQIDIPATQIEIGRYLRGCPEGYHKLFLSTEFPFAAERENLSMILMHVPHQEGDFSRFFLDLDYSTPAITETSLEAIDQILERAHSRIEEVFETTLTDESRRLFGWERQARPYDAARPPLTAGVIHEDQAPYGGTTQVQSFLPATPVHESVATPRATAAGVAVNLVELYDERLLELGDKVGKSAAELEAERWEQELEMADIVFKEPDVPSYRIKGILNYVGREEPPTYHFDEAEDD